MIRELAKKEFRNTEYLFSSLAFNLLVESVLHGHTHGKVWTNRLQKPTIAVLWTTMTDMLFSGKIDEAFLSEFKQELVSALIPKMQKMKIPVLILYYPNEKWKAALQNLLPNNSLTEIERYSFLLENFDDSVLNEKYKIEPITNSFLANKLPNWQQVVGWIYSFWQDLEDFHENGIGFFLTENNKIASWCISVYKGNNKYELGLATASEYQGKGFATQIAAYTIKKCLHKNIEPVWQCDADNIASVKLAKKLGYGLDRKYSVLQIQL